MTNNHFFSKKLREAIESKGLTHRAFVQACEISAPALHNYLNGREPQVGMALKMARILGVSVDWLLDNETFVSHTIANHASEDGLPVPHHNTDALTQPQKGIQAIPISAKFAAGQMDQGDILPEEQTYLHLPETFHIPKDAIACQVYGDSMEPLLYDGDYVIMRAIKDPRSIRSGADYGVVTKRGPMIKRFYQVPTRHQVCLRSYNDAYSDVVLDEEEILSVYEILTKIERQYRVPWQSEPFRVARLMGLMPSAQSAVIDSSPNAKFLNRDIE